jgi:hypothetical protein
VQRGGCGYKLRSCKLGFAAVPFLQAEASAVSFLHAGVGAVSFLHAGVGAVSFLQDFKQHFLPNTSHPVAVTSHFTMQGWGVPDFKDTIRDMHTFSRVAFDCKHDC